MHRVRFFLGSSLVSAAALVSPLALADETLPPASPTTPTATSAPGASTPQPAPMHSGGTAVSTTQTTSASTSDFPENQKPILMGDRVTQSTINRPLLITGSVVLLGSYVPAAIVASQSPRHEDERLYVPVVGPWLDLANRDCSQVNCPNETRNKTLLIGGGILQGLGTVGVISSFFIPEKKNRSWWMFGSEKVTVAPTNTASGAGLSAFGQF